MQQVWHFQQPVVFYLEVETRVGGGEAISRHWIWPKVFTAKHLPPQQNFCSRVPSHWISLLPQRRTCSRYATFGRLFQQWKGGLRGLTVETARGNLNNWDILALTQEKARDSASVHQKVLTSPKWLNFSSVMRVQVQRTHPQREKGKSWGEKMWDL